MSPQDENQQDTARTLQGLIAAFSGPHLVHPAYVDHVLAQSAEQLAVLQGRDARSDRPRMPTLMWPRSAFVEVPDAPPVPPAAL
jgi:hypothetical protein